MRDRLPTMTRGTEEGTILGVQSVLAAVHAVGADPLPPVLLLPQRALPDGDPGGVDAVAGFGTGVRLEYLLIPLVFGLGAPLVALVGTNIGAGQQQRALHIALTGGALAFALTETVGLVAAIWPAQWLSLFSAEPSMIESGSAYLRIVGPAYGFFGLGLSLYFASQGAGRLFWPLFFGFLRVFISIVGGWLVLRWTGSLEWMFAALALGLVVFGTSVALAIRSGAWFRGQ